MTRLRAITHFGVQARHSLLEYAQALRSQYFGALREQKGKILAEFTHWVTGIMRQQGGLR